ncbi:MAG: ABC transporter permease, partial [Chloroflexi bacterium]|nr:ABC transporter permease [Chloroflexota bacterium]
SASFECTYGTYIRMERQRTFDAIIATPLSVEDVVAGEIFWGATRSLITGGAILGVAAIFQLVPSPWALFIPVISFLGGLMFSAIAMLFTSLAPSIYSFNYYFTLFMTPMFFFSGVFFPLTSFPEIIQTFSWIVPLTPLVHLTRAFVHGNFHISLFLSLAIVIFITVLFFLLSLVTMRRRITV